MNEADLKFAQDLLSLMEKLAVGVAAIAGSLFTQWATNKWARERDNEKLLQEKAEKLVLGIQALDEWIGHAQNRALFPGDLTSEKRDFVGQVMALFELYFPSLEKEYKALMKSVDITLTALGDQQVLRDPDKWANLFKEYLKASRQCVLAISKHVRQVH